MFSALQWRRKGGDIGQLEYCALCTECVVCTVYCVYCVLCVLCTVCTVYCVHCVYSAQKRVGTVGMDKCPLDSQRTVHCVLCSVCTVHFVYCALCEICVLCTVQRKGWRQWAWTVSEHKSSPTRWVAAYCSHKNDKYKF